MDAEKTKDRATEIWLGVSEHTHTRADIAGILEAHAKEARAEALNRVWREIRGIATGMRIQDLIGDRFRKELRAVGDNREKQPQRRDDG